MVLPFAPSLEEMGLDYSANDPNPHQGKQSRLLAHLWAGEEAECSGGFTERMEENATPLAIGEEIMMALIQEKDKT